MQTSFSIPRLSADRLTRLNLACSEERNALGHIGVRVTPDSVRFSATNGRILASVLIPIEGFQGTAGDVILDSDQFTAVLKAAMKIQGGRIQFRIDPAEVRLTIGTASALVRRIEGNFPTVEHVWTRFQDRRWVPNMNSLDTHLAGIAQKISGAKTSLLFSSPVPVAARIERAWAVPGAEPGESVPLSDLRVAVTAPAFWADHELALLVMPVTRHQDERFLDLAKHALPLPATSIAAAAA